MAKFSSVCWRDQALWDSFVNTLLPSSDEGLFPLVAA